MAHLISEASVTGKAEAFYALEPAWHGLGTVLDHVPDSASAIEAAGLGWQVDQLPLVARKAIATPEGDVVRDIDAKDYVANVRSDTGAILGVVGSSYRIVQNRDAFAFLDGLLADGIMRYESAGALRDGRTVWVLARMPKDDQSAPGDVSRRYVLFTTSHDGTGAVRALPTSVRVVCANTLGVALRSREGVTIRHTGDIDGKLRAAQLMLAQFNDAFDNHAQASRLLAGKRFCAASLARYLDKVLPPVDKEGRAKTIRDNDRATVLANLENPRQRVGGIAGTWWAAVNAVTELYDHGSTVRGQTTREKGENRFMASFGLHGYAAGEKRAAFDTALSMAGAV